MELKDLMSGIGVAIDDAFGRDDDDAQADGIFEIVRQIERNWSLPFSRLPDVPPPAIRRSLLQAASFILLDWRLWRTAALEREGVKKNIEFLEEAKNCFVPVFIFTNDAEEDVIDELPETIYTKEAPEKSFVFVRHKASLFSNKFLKFNDIEGWVRANASVYAMKTWNRVLQVAKAELFGSMYARSPDWPRVFWRAYEEDGADPSSSLTHLINDNLRARMRTSAFEADILGGHATDVRRDDLRALIGETCFSPKDTLQGDEVRCGDMFRASKGKYLLNIRPDCDCVARDGQTADEVVLYCIEGKKMRDAELDKQYREGHFVESVWENVVFSAHEGRTIRFDFRRFRLEEFSTLRNGRVGRLLHPYLTRLQQRFGLYLQRQGLPRIPQEAIPPKRTRDGETES